MPTMSKRLIEAGWLARRPSADSTASTAVPKRFQSRDL